MTIVELAFLLIFALCLAIITGVFLASVVCAFILSGRISREEERERWGRK